MQVVGTAASFGSEVEVEALGPRTRARRARARAQVESVALGGRPTAVQHDRRGALLAGVRVAGVAGEASAGLGVVVRRAQQSLHDGRDLVEHEARPFRILTHHLVLLGRAGRIERRQRGAGHAEVVGERVRPVAALTGERAEALVVVPGERRPHPRQHLLPHPRLPVLLAHLRPRLDRGRRLGARFVRRGAQWTLAREAPRARARVRRRRPRGRARARRARTCEPSSASDLRIGPHPIPRARASSPFSQREMQAQSLFAAASPRMSRGSRRDLR